MLLTAHPFLWVLPAIVGAGATLSFVLVALALSLFRPKFRSSQQLKSWALMGAILTGMCYAIFLPIYLGIRLSSSAWSIWGIVWVFLGLLARRRVDKYLGLRK